MKIQIVRDDGRYITIGKNMRYNWALVSVSGISDLENEIGMEPNAMSDGSQKTYQRYPAKLIDIDFCYTISDPQRTAKRSLLSFLDGKKQYEIRITEGDVTRWIKGEISAYKVDNPNGSSKLKASVSFICPDPFFNSSDNFGKDLASIEKKFAFVWFNPIDETSPIGTYNFERQIEISNTGDVASYPAIRITASGTVVNPKLIINDKYIRLIDTLVLGDEVAIDLAAKTIKKNGDNCIGLTDRTSSFTDMTLVPGKNIVKYEADQGDVNMAVVLYYYNKYRGA